MPRFGRNSASVGSSTSSFPSQYRLPLRCPCCLSTVTEAVTSAQPYFPDDGRPPLRIRYCYHCGYYRPGEGGGVEDANDDDDDDDDDGGVSGRYEEGWTWDESPPPPLPSSSSSSSVPRQRQGRASPSPRLTRAMGSIPSGSLVSSLLASPTSLRRRTPTQRQSGTTPGLSSRVKASADYPRVNLSPSPYPETTTATANQNTQPSSSQRAVAYHPHPPPPPPSLPRSSSSTAPASRRRINSGNFSPPQHATAPHRPRHLQPVKVDDDDDVGEAAEDVYQEYRFRTDAEEGEEEKAMEEEETEEDAVEDGDVGEGSAHGHQVGARSPPRSHPQNHQHPHPQHPPHPPQNRPDPSHVDEEGGDEEDEVYYHDEDEYNDDDEEEEEEEEEYEDEDEDRSTVYEDRSQRGTQTALPPTVPKQPHVPLSSGNRSALHSVAKANATTTTTTTSSSLKTTLSSQRQFYRRHSHPHRHGKDSKQDDDEEGGNGDDDVYHLLRDDQYLRLSEASLDSMVRRAAADSRAVVDELRLTTEPVPVPVVWHILRCVANAYEASRAKEARRYAAELARVMRLHQEAVQRLEAVEHLIEGLWERENYVHAQLSHSQQQLQLQQQRCHSSPPAAPAPASASCETEVIPTVIARLPAGLALPTPTAEHRTRPASNPPSHLPQVKQRQ